MTGRTGLAGTADKLKAVEQEHPWFIAHCHGISGPRREVVLGDDAGGLHSFSADERDKRERAAAPLYAFEGRACAPITGLQQHALAGRRTLVLVATATRLHAFAGGPTLEALFSAYPESSGMPTPVSFSLANTHKGAGDQAFSHVRDGWCKTPSLVKRRACCPSAQACAPQTRGLCQHACHLLADLANFREAPGEGGVGALCDWAPPGTERAQRVAWLGASGVLHARLAPPRPQVPPCELDYLEEATLRPLSGPAGAESPTAVVRRSAHACPEQGSP